MALLEEMDWRSPQERVEDAIVTRFVDDVLLDATSITLPGHGDYHQVGHVLLSSFEEELVSWMVHRSYRSLLVWILGHFDRTGHAERSSTTLPHVKCTRFARSESMRAFRPDLFTYLSLSK